MANALAAVQAAADDIVLRMPVGTIITDLETESVIGELLEPGQRILLCKGGDGGFGNLHFKTSTNRAPRRPWTSLKPAAAPCPACNYASPAKKCTTNKKSFRRPTTAAAAKTAS